MNTETPTLLQTPLYDSHIALGAKMVPFAGYAMPVQYPLGILKEHQHTRAQAGLFDVSHMGQVRLSGENVAAELEKLLPQDIQGLAVNRQRYALLMNDDGGIRDDLMVANCGDHFLLVVNAACKQADVAYLRASLPASIELELMDDRALLALQGPAARSALARLAPAVAQLTFMETGEFSVGGIDCWISCSGYTGEDGFELSVAGSQAPALFELLVAQEEIEAVGLGARDSLRLEAGLCLYGHDIDETTSPVEAGLKWAINPVRRPGGERAGGHPGADRLAREWEEGATRRRTLLQIDGRAPVREGANIVNEQGEALGVVTSGGFGPTAGGPVAMGYVNAAALDAGTPLFAELRKKLIPLKPTAKPFVEQRYYRG